MRGLFVTFEGVEGSGKSTQAQIFARWLKENGKQVLFLREPGSTKIGEKIREILLFSGPEEILPLTELLLFLASRAQLVREKILPALEKGITVVLDRYSDSTLAYQGYGENIPLSKIEMMNEFVTSGLLPDITFLLDLEVEKIFEKLSPKDRIERKGLEFHKRVRRGYHQLAEKSKGRICLLKVKDEPSTTQEEIRKIFQERFPSYFK